MKKIVRAGPHLTVVSATYCSFEWQRKVTFFFFSFFLFFLCLQTQSSLRCLSWRHPQECVPFYVSLKCNEGECYLEDMLWLNIIVYYSYISEACTINKPNTTVLMNTVLVILRAVFVDKCDDSMCECVCVCVRVRERVQ